MLNKILTILKLLTLSLLVLFSSCTGFVDVTAPEHLLDAEYVFSNDETAEATVRGMYSKMVVTQEPFSHYGLSLYPGLMADELVSVSTNAVREAFQYNSLLANNSVVLNQFWRKAYELIYHANSCLEGLQKSTGVSAAKRKQLMGEMHLMRAFFYFHLVNLFGPVPLQKITDYEVNMVLPRAAAAEVNALILADATAALQELPARMTGDVKTRPCREAALALLSRIYLFREQWQQTVDMATELINSKHYLIEPDLRSVFLTGSREMIWQLGSTVGTNSIMQAMQYVPATATIRPQLAATASLVNAFEAGDLRRIHWLHTTTVLGKTYYYPYKYNNRSSNNTTETIGFIRLAEIYLNRAEAYMALGNLPAALEDVNVIRSRAGLPVLGDTTSITTLTTVIARERRVEMMFEWGHRWYDLKRTSQANTVLALEKGSYWQSTDLLLPVPEAEIKLNANLVQNDGYQ